MLPDKEHNHLIYNGFDFGDMFDVNYSRSIAPEINVNTLSISGRDGALYRGSTLKPLTIKCQMRMRLSKSTEVADIRRAVAQVLMVKEPKPLWLPDEPTRFYLAVPSGKTDLDTMLRTAEFNIEFLCPDPIAYGNRHSITFDTAQERIYEIDNTGNYKTPLVFDMKITSLNNVDTYLKLYEYQPPRDNTDGYISNMTSGIRGGIQQFSKVTVDSKQRILSVNKSQLRISIDSDFTFADPGRSHIIFDDAFDAKGSISWEDRWV